MSQYVCTVCGYVYDEEQEGVNFDSLLESWKCPLCGASKSQFEKKSKAVENVAPLKNENFVAKTKTTSNKALSNAELYVICSNLAKGCEKQYMAEETSLFNEIADYYKTNCEPLKTANNDDIGKLLMRDLSELYPSAFSYANDDADRGALRALTWSEKVSKIANTLLERYKKEGTSFLLGNKIYVCEICGFIYIGESAPDVCPICKVPQLKIHEVRRT